MTPKPEPEPRRRVKLVLETEGKPTLEYVFPHVVNADFRVELPEPELSLAPFEIIPPPARVEVSLHFAAVRESTTETIYTLKVDP